MLEENGDTWQLNMASPACSTCSKNSICSKIPFVSPVPFLSEMFHLVPLVPKVPFVPSVPPVPFCWRCSISFHLFRLFHSVPGVPLVPEIPFVPHFSPRNLNRKWNVLIINWISNFLDKMEQVERVEHGTERNECG